MKNILGFFKKHYKKMIILLVIIILAIIFIIVRGGEDKNKVIVNDVVVSRGTIINSIDGKSTIKPKDSYTVTSSVTGDVIECTFEEGDVVKKDDKMYKIDTSDMDKSLTSAKLNIEKAEMNLSSIKKSVEDLTVTSRYSGVISKLHVEKGDTIGANSVIADIYDPNRLKIKIPFNEMDTKSLYVGAIVDVNLLNTNSTVKGTIKSIASASIVSSGYMRIRDVEIEVKNPGGISVGDKAIASFGDITCNDYGTFEYIVNDVILSTGSGDIISLNIEEGQTITEGYVVLQLENDSLNDSLRNAEIMLEEAYLNLNQVEDNIDKYTIKAPIGGTVITKNVKLDDKVDVSKGLTTMATIFDLSSIEFDISIDEIDIAKLSVGQKVIVFADAITDRSYDGVIDKISIDGKSTNGVTTYPVTVRIDEYDGLLPGMNIDAEIVLQQVDDVLMVPKNAVNRGNTVYMKGEKKDPKDNAPEGYYTVPVEVGVTDGTNVEIVSGLKEGDIIRGAEINADAFNLNDIMKGAEANMPMHGGGNMPKMPGQ